MADLIFAGDFATDGERRAAAELRRLPDGWIVICNKILPTANGRSFEIDFIVIGRRHVFLLDEKSWKGQIRGSDQIWVRADGSSEDSPINKVDYVAKVLAGFLRQKVPALGRERAHFVRSGILLSNAERTPQIRDPRSRETVFLLAQVCNRLTELDQQGGLVVVGQQREAIQHALVDLSDRPRVPRQIDLYTIEEATDGMPGTRIFSATVEGGERRTLMVYDLSNDQTTAAERRDFYLREFRSLQALRDTGIVPEVKDPFVWSQDYLVVPVVPPAGKPLGMLPKPDTREDLVQELLIAEACFKALDALHERQVIHRALSPSAIYVASASQTLKVAFTNFYAARMDGQSIALKLDELAIQDPYAAPELAGSYGLATRETDTYSLGLILLERLTGIALAELRTAEGRIAVPDLHSRWQSLPEDIPENITILLRTVIAPDEEQPPRSAGIIGSLLGDTARRLRIETGDVEGRMLDRRYKVIQLLGQGSMARTYLATDTSFPDLGFFALKQFLFPSVVYEQAQAEFGTLRNLNSLHLPRVYDINPPDHDVHVKMEYIPGPTLQELEKEFPWPLERWWRLASQLLDAIETLEQHRLLHRDIKPSNIMLHEHDDRVVLIDFGFAATQGSEHRAAGTLLYLPPEALTSAQPPPDSDRYAAAVVMFRVLVGVLPFHATDRTQLILPESVDERVLRIAQVLHKALAPSPDERPSSTAALRQDLQAAMQAIDTPTVNDALPALINPWVDDVRGLYRNSATGNADNRGLDSDFVRTTYVQTALDTHVLPLLLKQRPFALFLCGNPGDGKTAFLEQVRDELSRAGAHEIQADESGWEYQLDGHTFRSCYDASESHDGQSADAQLTARLAGLEGSGRPDGNGTALIAINDGRLADFFVRFQATFPWLARQVEHLLQRRSADEHVWMIDLKRRAFVALPGAAAMSLFQQVALRLVDEEPWQMCGGCAAHAICPMYANALSLREPMVRDRLETVMLLAHLRRQRHTTMRDLRSALAYLITGNLRCHDVHMARTGTDSGARLIERTYWQSVFAPAETSDEVLADLRMLDPADQAHPRLDRFLHYHQTLADAPRRNELFTDGKDVPLQRFIDEKAWIHAFKRRLFFEASDVAHTLRATWQDLLPYRYANDFLMMLSGHGNLDLALRRIALGMLRSDGIFERVAEDQLSLKVAASSAQQLVVLKQFPLEQFQLSVDTRVHAFSLESIPEVLVLEHHAGIPRLEITLDLFELLMRCADGLRPDAPELRPLLEDLAPFKSSLLLRETFDLVLVEGQYRLHQITQREGKIIRLLEEASR
jgi:serine/threonine protein kinase